MLTYYLMNYLIGLLVILKVSICQIQYINPPINDSIVIKTYRPQYTNDLIWLQQLKVNLSTTNKTVFYRTSFLDNKKTKLFRYGFQDPNNQLIIKGVDPVYLRCAIFYNKTSKRYFRYLFPSNVDKQYVLSYLQQNITKQYELLNQTITFKVCIYGWGFIINNQKLYKIKENIYLTPTNQWILVIKFQYLISLKNFNILGIDQQYYYFLTDQSLYGIYYIGNQIDYTDKQNENNYIYGTQLINSLTKRLNIDLTMFQKTYITQEDILQQKIINNLAFQYIIGTRITIFSTKKLQNNTYLYIIIFLSQPQDLNEDIVVIKNVTNQIKNQPFWKYSPLLTKFIIYSNSTLYKPEYHGYYVDYTKSEVYQIQFPTIFKTYSYPNYFTLNQFFLYVRNSIPFNDQHNHSAYTFLNQLLYPIFQQQPILQPQLNNNWVTTFIDTSEDYNATQFTNRSMLIFHLHQSYNQYYFKRQIIQPYYKKQYSYYRSFVQMNFTIPINLNSNYYWISKQKTDFLKYNSASKPSQLYKWLYLVQDKIQNQSITQIFLKQYDINKKNQKLIKRQFFNKSFQNFQQYQYNDKMNCFYTQQYQKSSLSFFKILNSSIQFIGEIYSQQFPNKFPKTNNQSRRSHIVIGSNCQKIKVLDNFYFLDNSTTPPKYEIQTNLPFNVNNTIVDYDLIFAISSSNLYKYNGEFYEKIVTSNFKPLNELFISEDKNVVYIKSYEKKVQIAINNLSLIQETNQYCVLQNKIFYNSNNGWIQLVSNESVNIDKKILMYKIYVQTSINLQTISVCYVLTNQIDMRQRQYQCLFIMIDFVNLKRYDQLYKLPKLVAYSVRNIENMYIYILQTTLFDSQTYFSLSKCVQKIFQIKNFTLNLLTQFQIDCNFYNYHDQFIRRRVFQTPSNKSFYYVWQYINDSKITLLNSTSKSIQIIKSQLQFNGLDQGYFYSNGSFHHCGTGCKRCMNYHFCIKCIHGYYMDLVTLKCLKCGSNCKSCHYLNPQVCTGDCFEGQYFMSNRFKCLKCNQNCLTCSGQSQQMCTSCKIGYFFNKNIQKNIKISCIKCPENCDFCLNSTYCNTCQYGYTVSSNGSCLKCPLNCNSCKAEDITKCNSCRKGFQLTISSNKILQCKKCPNYCQKCQAEICSLCRYGYTLSVIDNICLQRCLSPCKNCYASNSQICIQCLPGYFLKQSECLPDLSCNEKPQDCLSCPIGYAFLNGKCRTCSVSQNCAQCHAYDPSTCIVCKKGYYFFSNSCLPCLDNCQECDTNRACKKCKKGYMFSLANLYSSQCIKCSPNCKECIQSMTNCQSCNDGYQLVGSTCVRELQIKFNIKLDLDYANLSSQICQKMISDIAQICNKEENVVYLTSLKNGSAIFEGIIDVQNLTDEQQTLNSLNKKLSTGSVIGDYQILKSQFTGLTSNTTVYSQNSSINLGLILGITIPGFVGLSLIISFIVYKKFFGLKDKVEQKGSDRSSETRMTSEADSMKVIQARNKNIFSNNTKGSQHTLIHI